MRNDCEIHDQVGDCTLECADLLQNMTGGYVPYGEDPFNDPTGCRYPHHVTRKMVEYDMQHRRVLLHEVRYYYDGRVTVDGEEVDNPDDW